MRARLLTGQAAACPSDGPVRDPSVCVQLIVLPSAALVRRSRGPPASAPDSPPPHLLKLLMMATTARHRAEDLQSRKREDCGGPVGPCLPTGSYWFLLVPAGPVPLLVQFISQWSTFFFFSVVFFLSKYSLNIPLTNLLHGYR